MVHSSLCKMYENQNGVDVSRLWDAKYGSRNRAYTKTIVSVSIRFSACILKL